MCWGGWRGLIRRVVSTVPSCCSMVVAFWSALGRFRVWWLEAGNLVLDLLGWKGSRGYCERSLCTETSLAQSEGGEGACEVMGHRPRTEAKCISCIKFIGFKSVLWYGRKSKGRSKSRSRILSQ